jgi:hypothetical protein
LTLNEYVISYASPKSTYFGEACRWCVVSTGYGELFKVISIDLRKRGGRRKREQQSGVDCATHASRRRGMRLRRKTRRPGPR